MALGAVELNNGIFYFFCVDCLLVGKPRGIFGIVDELHRATPLLGSMFAYAYGGLYINACKLRNPFNNDHGYTGIPINAFIQRLERTTEAVLLGSKKVRRENDLSTGVESAPQPAWRRRL